MATQSFVESIALVSEPKQSRTVVLTTYPNGEVANGEPSIILTVPDMYTGDEGFNNVELTFDEAKALATLLNKHVGILVRQN